jgi:hypothetical protein
VLKLNYADHIVKIFFEILYGNYKSIIKNKLKNIKDLLSLIDMMKYLDFTPKNNFIEDLLGNFEFDEINTQNLEMIKNINNDSLKNDFLAKFIYKQLSKIDEIITEYDDYYPKKERLGTKSEKSIKEIIKTCLDFHKIKYENIVVEVSIWTDHETHEFVYELYLKVDKIIKENYKDSDIDYLVNRLMNLVMAQWNNEMSNCEA